MIKGWVQSRCQVNVTYFPYPVVRGGVNGHRGTFISPVNIETLITLIIPKLPKGGAGWQRVALFPNPLLSLIQGLVPLFLPVGRWKCYGKRSVLTDFWH